MEFFAFVKCVKFIILAALVHLSCQRVIPAEQTSIPTVAKEANPSLLQSVGFNLPFISGAHLGVEENAEAGISQQLRDTNPEALLGDEQLQRIDVLIESLEQTDSVSMSPEDKTSPGVVETSDKTMTNAPFTFDVESSTVSTNAPEAETTTDHLTQTPSTTMTMTTTTTSTTTEVPKTSASSTSRTESSTTKNTGKAAETTAKTSSTTPEMKSTDSSTESQSTEIKFSSASGGTVSTLSPSTTDFEKTMEQVASSSTISFSSQTTEDKDLDVSTLFDNIHTSLPFSNNKFVTRERRQTQDCPLPHDVDEQLKKFAGAMPTPLVKPADFDDQPSQCPKATGDWWPRSELNLRASCPWIYKESSWEEQETRDYYPKTYLEAQCLCENCVNADMLGCKKLNQDFVILEKVGCDSNGMAVMKPVIKAIAVSCLCAKDLPAAPQPTVSESFYTDLLS